MPVTDSLPHFMLIAAVLCNGLLAGAFFVFACAVCPALRRCDDRTYVSAVRAINSSILNPWFLSVFLAAPISAIAAVVFSSGSNLSSLFPLVLAGCLFSSTTFLITGTANVPLNRMIETGNVTTEAQCRSVRHRFEGRWNGWNLARTITGTLAFGLFAAASFLTE